MAESYITYDRCPVCNASRIGEVFTCRDYTVSRQFFPVWECHECKARFTQQVPDEAHISPFYQSPQYISHSDTSDGFVSKIYKLARIFTLKHKRKQVQDACGLSLGSVLDVGSGTGAFLHTMKKAGWQITGLEPDNGAREKATSIYGIKAQPNETLFQLEPKSFDAITLWHVLEHIHDLHGYFSRFAQLLKPSGVLLIAVPNYTCSDARHYGAAWAAYDVPRHLYHFSPSSVRHLAEQYGFSVKKIKPMWLDAFYISLLSEQYQHGKQRIIPALIQGIKSVFHAYLNPNTCSSQVYILKLRKTWPPETS